MPAALESAAAENAHRSTIGPSGFEALEHGRSRSVATIRSRDDLPTNHPSSGAGGVGQTNRATDQIRQGGTDWLNEASRTQPNGTDWLGSGDMGSFSPAYRQSKDKTAGVAFPPRPSPDENDTYRQVSADLAGDGHARRSHGRGSRVAARRRARKTETPGRICLICGKGQIGRMRPHRASPDPEASPDPRGILCLFPCEQDRRATHPSRTCPSSLPRRSSCASAPP